MRRQPQQARSQARVNQILDVAEQLFIELGYDATTTNAIAARAKVAIGSLYQFFPDKAAILKALAARYNEQLHQLFVALHTNEVVKLSLEAYVDLVIDAIDQFFRDHPGYYVIFMQLQEPIPELEAMEVATDAQLMQELATFLTRRNPGLELASYQAIALVIVKTVGTLLWLSLSQNQASGKQLVIETKRLTLSYLQSYFPDNASSNHAAS
ncbi:TetR family transcriptional regulator [Iningainema sp. BLCCT55]|uniref:TetR family transcriptional regulator n=2 Tax=Iningainema TaxID=1932705 RepID=A0A8J6Y2N2_9CYAN|nr:TetR family transcriptional regulator [Iningainema tapete BLCC-T55]